jgi:sulfonate transport system permease protein
VLLGLSRPTDRAIGPSFHAVRQIAIFAWVPLLTAWFGNGESGKVVFIALGAFYPVVMGTYEGIRGVPPHLREIGQLYCFGPWRLLRRIVLPAAVPAIVGALQLALIFSWLATIGAEYLMGGASRGGREQLRTDIVLLGVTVIAASGYLLNTLLRAGSRRMLRWRDAAF